MKKFSNSPAVFMGIMLAACASLIFGLFFGPKYPNIFFWSFMTCFVAIIALYVSTNVKDTVILIGVMVFLGIWGTIVENFILSSLSEGIVRFLLTCILLFPVYYTLAMHLVKMIVKRKKLNEE